MTKMNSFTFFYGFGYITVYILLSYRYSYFRRTLLGGSLRPFYVLLLVISSYCIKTKCQITTFSVSISWLLISKLYKLVSYVILAVAISVHNKGIINLTDTSRKAHERFTMLTDIQHSAWYIRHYHCKN